MSELPGRERHKGKGRDRKEDGSVGSAAIQDASNTRNQASGTAGNGGNGAQANGKPAVAGSGPGNNRKFIPSEGRPEHSGGQSEKQAGKRRRKKRRPSGGSSPGTISNGAFPGTGKGAEKNGSKSADYSASKRHGGNRAEVSGAAGHARGAPEAGDNGARNDRARNGGKGGHRTGDRNAHEPHSAEAQRPASRKRKRGGRKAGRSGDGDSTPRGMRAPVQPVPVASYTPVDRETGQERVDTGWDRNRKRSGHPAVRRQRDANLYAALDLGTNNCRLLVALPQQRGRFRVVDGFSRIVRLGEGLAHTGQLSDAAMDRALEALKVCAGKLQNHSIRRARLIATEACRQADNGEMFIERVRVETGLELEIINRETEAYLAAEGCGQLMDRKADAAVLFDIGGGSSELMLVDRRNGRKRISDQIVSWTSLPMGVVTLAERHGGRQVGHESFRKMVDEVKEHLHLFSGKEELERIWRKGRVHLLGTSGTVTTLAGIHLNLERYDRRRVDGLWMKSSEIDVVVQSLLSMDYDERAASPCIGQERADLVMAGCAILEAIRETWPADRLRVADRGLREGILTQLISMDGAWLKPKQGRWSRKPAKGGFTGTNKNGNSGGHRENRDNARGDDR